MESATQSAPQESKGRNPAMENRRVSDGWTLMQDLLPSLLKVLEDWEGRSGLDTHAMAERLLSEFTAMGNTEQSTSDLEKILIDTWESVLKPGGLTMESYGLLTSLLNVASAGKAPVITKWGRYSKIRTPLP
jgi:hypothetical protein